MWLWFLAILLTELNFISSQPLNENARSQSNMECCPCPKDDTLSANHKGAFIPGVDWPDSTSARFGQDQLADPTGESAFIRSGVVDDCPCRFRDADSSGATSILIPSAVRALWPVVSEDSKPSKEDPKPLLHPEVDFASSVLETLRQATDEEYEDALARDAAKSVMKAADPDLIDVSAALDTAKNIVDVILKPNDFSDSEDGLQEASHVQESRCIHPLESNIKLRQENLNPSPLLNGILAVPNREPLSLLHRNVWDMDSSTGASNVNEQIADNKNILHGLNLKSNPSMFNLFSVDKNNILNNNSGFVKNTNIMQLPSFEPKPLRDLGKHLEILNNKLNASHFDLKLKLEQTKSTLDNNPLTDILQKQNVDNKFKFKPLFPINNLEFTTKKPLTLKNFLKLKDVELIPPVKVNNKQLTKAIEDSDKIATNLFKNAKSPDLNDIFNNGFKFDFKNGIKSIKPITNVQSIPNRKKSKLDVLDVITSPSEININSVNNKFQDYENFNSAEKIEKPIANNFENSEQIKININEKMPKTNSHEMNHAATIECNTREATDTATINNFQESTKISFKKIESTEILDAVPSPSEIHEFEEENLDEINPNITFNIQIIRNDKTGINSPDENFSHEDIEVEESDEGNDKDEEENESRNNNNDSDEQQQNCVENNVEEQGSQTATSNNIANMIEPEKNQEEVQNSFLNTGDIDSNESCINEDAPHSDVNAQDFLTDNNSNESCINEDIEDNEDSDKQQQNCLENKVEEQGSGPITSNNIGNTVEPKGNHEDVKDSISNISDIDSNESCINEDHSNTKEQDSLPEASNNVPNIIQPKETQKEIPHSTSHTWSSPDLHSNESCIDKESREEDPIKIDSTTFKKPNKLSVLKENILRRLGELKNKKVSDTKKHSMSILNNIKKSEARLSEDCEDEFIIPVTKDENQIDIKDLQNISDKLLYLSSKRDQGTIPSKPEEYQKESFVNDSESDESAERSIITGGKDNENTVKDNVDINDSKMIADNLKDDNSISETNNVSDTKDTNIVNREKSCLANSNISPTSSVEDGIIMPSSKINEMAVAASDAFENRIKPVNNYKSSLLQDILHGKSSSIANNLKATSLDINKALSLPTLEDIKEGISNIFEQSKNNVEDLSTIQQRNMNNLDPLVEADTPTIKSLFPPLQPLQDIDLDIFQLKPFTLSGSHQLLPKLPRLNLNSYKAKLSLPKSKNLKPMKLASSLGDKNGLFGATLTIGSDKISPFGKTPNLLGIHIDNLPSLDELRTTLRENAQNLLATPLETTGRNVIEDTFRSGQTISDNIRSHTKNTVKNIQQTLETTLRDARENDLLGDSVRNPQDFLQTVVRRHEDFTDKLKGIHYDLSDRLESLRDRIIEQPLLPSLTFPTMKQSNNLHTPVSNFMKDEYIFSTSDGKKSNSQFIKKSSTPKTKSQKHKKLKMPAASSVPVPKTVEVPKLTPISTKSSLLNHSNLKTPQLLLNKKTISELLREPVSRFHDSKIPVLSRLRENNIKISFSTNPRPDISISKNKPNIISPKLNSKSNNQVLKKSNVQNSPIFNTRPFYDANGAPSEVSTSKLKPSLSFPNKPIQHTEEEKANIPEERFLKPNLNKISNPSFKNTERFVNADKTNPFPSKVDKNTDKLLHNDNKLQGTPILKSVAASKNKDILTTLREAVRARLSNVNLTTNKALEPKSALDMTKSASENLDMVSYAGQSLKENTSYTCRMMCTRNE